jgi:CheY-like chemotaxis protein
MAPRILVVEDNQKNRMLMRDILTYHGYEVIEAEDGSDGISLARDHRPDLIFMDIQMRTLDGLTAIQMLKDDPATRHIKVIAVTSFAMNGDGEKFLAAGADGYLPKPINTRSVPALVARVLGGGSLSP